MPNLAGQAKQHRLFGGDVRFDVGCVALRHIPYTVIHGAGRLAEYGYAAVGDGNQSEFGFHHGGFPVPLVPTMAVTEPCGIRKVPCCQMMCPPRETPASSNSIQNDALSCMARSLDKSTIVFSQTVLTIILNKKHAWTMKSLMMNPPRS